MQNTEPVAHSANADAALLTPSYRRRLHAVLTPSEHRVFARLDTPQKIQNFLDRLPVNFSLDGDTAIHHTILRLEPGRLLSYRTVKSPTDFPFASTIGRTSTEIHFEPVDASRTKVTVTMRGYTADPEMQKMRAFFEWGNKASLDALVKRFAAR